MTFPARLTRNKLQGRSGAKILWVCFSNSFDQCVMLFGLGQAGLELPVLAVLPTFSSFGLFSALGGLGAQFRLKQ
jgi:hypothetical protein